VFTPFPEGFVRETAKSISHDHRHVPLPLAGRGEVEMSFAGISLGERERGCGDLKANSAYAGGVHVDSL